MPPPTPATATHRASLRTLDGAAPPVHAFSFKLREYQLGGWIGEAEVNPAASTTENVSFAEAFKRALAKGMTPGEAVALRLVKLSQEDDEGNEVPSRLLRSWPGMIARVDTDVTPGSANRKVTYKVRIADPLTYLSTRPIWGAFQDESPAKILGGLLSLATGGDGAPALRPALTGMPSVEIVSHLRAELATIPYAIACGETLSYWLRRVFARLGIRIEMEVGSDGGILMHLRDSDPTTEDTLAIMFEDPGALSETNAQQAGIEGWAVPTDRSVLLDNPAAGDARQFGDPADGSVREVLSAARLSVDEAALRAWFAPDAWLLSQSGLKVYTRQSLATPGRRFEFVNQLVDDAHVWQIGDVLHQFGGGSYNNEVWLMKGSLAWRPPIPADDGPRVVSGVIDDGSSDPGASVERDHLGRVPVRLATLPNVDEEDDASGSGASGSGASGASGDANAATQIISLPVLDLMGGGLHGFLPAHRQGDACRVLVHQPLFAEIQGFSYRDDRRIGLDQTDASIGLVAHRGTSNWAGLVFRPKEELEEEYGENGGDS